MARKRSSAARRDAGPGRPGRPDTPQSTDGILDVAERLLQTRGYNGFSYADIAADLGVTKASLHYHFATKAALGHALIERYAAAFARALAAIEADCVDPCERLQRYVDLYDAVIQGERMCLCGMLAAEVSTLPPAMQRRLNAFFDDNESWLARVLEAGRRRGKMRFEEPAVARARGIIGALEGAMLVARMYGDAPRFRSAAAQAIGDVCLKYRNALRGRARPRAPGPRAR
ncbi:MAG: TetR/AcrR family transcriptional regulator [Rubrivivax sp.]